MPSRLTGDWQPLPLANAHAYVAFRRSRHMTCQTSSTVFLSRLILALALCCGNVTVGQGIGELFEPVDDLWLSPQDRGESERDNEELETDRDSFTPATSTVGTGRFLFESSYSFIDNRSMDDTHSFPEILTRAGLTEHIELRFGWNYEIGGGGTVSGGDSGGLLEELDSSEESQLLYGIKVAMTEQDTWIPKSACILQGTTPTSGPETATDFQLGYVFGWEIFEDWQLDSSLRYVATKEEGDHFNDWAPSVVLKVPVAERWNVHAEYFGLFTDGRAENRAPQYFSPGIHYLISPDCEVGVRVGWGLNDDASNSFTNVGFGWRI